MARYRARPLSKMSNWLLALFIFAGVCSAVELGGHYSDIYQMLLRTHSLVEQHKVKQVLADEMITRIERNRKLHFWAEENNVREALRWFLNKEREYEHHNSEVQARKPHEIARASRMLRKISKCPHTTDYEKMEEVAEELATFGPELQHNLRILYPSLQNPQVHLAQLRRELEEGLFQEIEDKNAAILTIAHSLDKAPFHKRDLIERLIQSSDSRVAYVLRQLWPKIPGVQPIILNRRRRSHPKDLH